MSESKTIISKELTASRLLGLFFVALCYRVNSFLSEKKINRVFLLRIGKKAILPELTDPILIFTQKTKVEFFKTAFFDSGHIDYLNHKVLPTPAFSMRSSGPRIDQSVSF
jgi:hypothetical protein